jgi:hypothetical protein
VARASIVAANTGVNRLYRATAGHGQAVGAERWYIRNKTRPFTMRKALREHHMPGVIHPDDVQGELGNIDAEQADLRRVYLITTLPFTHF